MEGWARLPRQIPVHWAKDLIAHCPTFALKLKLKKKDFPSAYTRKANWTLILEHEIAAINCLMKHATLSLATTAFFYDFQLENDTELLKFSCCNEQNKETKQSKSRILISMAQQRPTILSGHWLFPFSQDPSNPRSSRSHHNSLLEMDRNDRVINVYPVPNFHFPVVPKIIPLVPFVPCTRVEQSHNSPQIHFQPLCDDSELNPRSPLPSWVLLIKICFFIQFFFPLSSLPVSHCHWSAVCMHFESGRKTAGQTHLNNGREKTAYVPLKDLSPREENGDENLPVIILFHQVPVRPSS